MEPQGRVPGKGVEAVAAGTGALIGTAVGGPFGGVVGAAVTPHLTRLVGMAWDELRGRL